MPSAVNAVPPDATPPPITSATRPAPRERVLSFVKGLLEIEKVVERRLSALLVEYSGIESDTVYTPRDLASPPGIRGARSRLQEYRSMVEKLDVIVRDRWTARESLVRSADLDEPLKTQIRTSFAQAEPSIRTAVDRWMEACRTSARVTAEVLDFAERNSLAIKFEREQLAFATELISGEYRALQQKVAAAEHRKADAQRAAQSVDDGILPLLRKTLNQ
jgi:hypothetical protein